MVSSSRIAHHEIALIVPSDSPVVALFVGVIATPPQATPSRPRRRNGAPGVRGTSTRLPRKDSGGYPPLWCRKTPRRWPNLFCKRHQGWLWENACCTKASRRGPEIALQRSQKAAEFPALQLVRIPAQGSTRRDACVVCCRVLLQRSYPLLRTSALQYSKATTRLVEAYDDDVDGHC